MSTLLFQAILEAHGGKNVQAVYMPEVYKSITSYLLSKMGIEKYQKSEDEIANVIAKVCEFNCNVENNEIKAEQIPISILMYVDYTLLICKQIRSFNNRLECCKALFSDHEYTFTKWLINYKEADKDVVQEVRIYLAQEYKKFENNLERVNYNIGIGYYPEEQDKKLN